MVHLEQLLMGTAPRIDAAIKQQLVNLRMVRSGRLLNSVQTRMQKTSDSFALLTDMEAYGLKHNDRYGFIEQAMAPIESSLQEQVTTAIEQDVNALIDKMIKE